MLYDEFVSAYDAERRERNVFHDLMRRRVREILLVAGLFDSFVVESDGILNEQVYGEYYRLNLSSVPRVTSAYSEESALRLFAEGRFDLVILMAGLDFDRPLALAGKMKARWPSIQILLLATSNGGLASLDRARPELAYVDRVFVWNGYSKLFVGMIKQVEDLRNVEADARAGLVRVILLVEGSVRWYSRYLPILYRTVMRQTQALIEDEGAVETYKLLRARARPKILLASSYEEASAVLERHGPSLLAAICALRVPRGGAPDPEAGSDFIRRLREERPDLPLIAQSSADWAPARAAELGVPFADKRSESIERDLCRFLEESLRFGPFVFESEDGRPLASVRSIEEMIERLGGLDLACVMRHAERDDFSTWLLARGEIRVARALRARRPGDFADPAQARDYLLRSLREARRDKSRGMIPAFDEATFAEAGAAARLGGGSVGGKGRGILFLGRLLEDLDLGSRLGGGMGIAVPRSAFIGIDSFERFLDSNGLWSFAFYESSGEGGWEELRRRFLAASLDPGLRDRLRRFARAVRSPLAVRSSGLFEDMILAPFAGAYDSFALPNSHPDPAVRLARLEEAVKLVYASLFSPRARGILESSGYALEEERMAVVVQELAGDRRGRWFYPIASGSAQSFNYYPLSYSKPEDGLCVAALGLGTRSPAGASTFRFCPRYPRLESSPPERLLEDGQRSFAALDMGEAAAGLPPGDPAALAEVELSEAEADPLFDLACSTWDRENGRLVPGRGLAGPRVVDFANILKYDALPLAEAISAILELGEKAMRTAVELEYALSLGGPGDRAGGAGPGRGGPGLAPTLSLLQLRPLARAEAPSESEIDEADPADCLVVSPRSMGNGRDRSVADIVWVDPRAFDRSRTEAIAEEIGRLDAEMRALGRRYLLIGPGRWGTRDRWLGVPVSFSQISMARAIVEADIPGLSVESSMGSHFFHGVVSKGIGYLTVPSGGGGMVDWEWLYSIEPESRTEGCARTSLREGLDILMDGRRGRALVLKRAAARTAGGPAPRQD